MRNKYKLYWTNSPSLINNLFYIFRTVIPTWAKEVGLRGVEESKKFIDEISPFAVGRSPIAKVEMTKKKNHIFLK